MKFSDGLESSMSLDKVSRHSSFICSLLVTSLPSVTEGHTSV